MMMNDEKTKCILVLVFAVFDKYFQCHFLFLFLFCFSLISLFLSVLSFSRFISFESLLCIYLP